MDDFAITPARQVQTAREYLPRIGGAVPRLTITLGPSGILPVAMICAVTCIAPIVVSFTFVMGRARRTRAASKRQSVVIVISTAFLAIAVAWVALLAVVTWVEVHATSAE